MNPLIHFQDATPQTSGYMLAGYAVFFVVLATYLAGLWLRWKKLSRELDDLQKLENQTKP